MFIDNAALDIMMRGIVLAIIGIAWVIMLVRLLGLRSFSKMTSFDFVATVATGSLLAGAAQATSWGGFVQPLIAMAGIFLTQYCIAQTRQGSDLYSKIMENKPLMLMKDGVILREALKRSRVTEADLMAKLREANALDLNNVRAVVLETTGDIAVLHGDTVDASLLDGVRMPSA